MSPFTNVQNVRAYKPTRTDNEPKFNEFLKYIGMTSIATSQSANTGAAFGIQLIKQINYGGIISKSYYLSKALATDVVEYTSNLGPFTEVTEDSFILGNLKKVNSYKNYKGVPGENRQELFFEINLSEKDPVQTHHWRADVTRPASQIDL